jgi:hypothetical protein
MRETEQRSQAKNSLSLLDTSRRSPLRFPPFLKGAPMNDFDSDQVRELLRRVSYPGFSRDIVSAGFVGEIVTAGPRVEIEFKPNTRDDAKISEMEHAIRDLLLEASFLDVRIRRVNPFVADAPLRSATDHAHDHAHHHHAKDHSHHGAAAKSNGCGCESNGKSRLMTPLQAEYLEDGELPEADLLAIALGRPDVAKAAGYGPGGPKPLSGPREDISYDCGIQVLQWDINPHDPQAKTCQHEIKLGEWDYRVWWQVHPSGLLYVSMQAMREDWVENEGAVPHPIGRSEAVNLVYDEKRGAVVAIYGTVRDFRPFVKAFSEAFALENSKPSESTNPEGVES